MNNEEFMQLREESYKFGKVRIQNLLKEFLTEIGAKDNFVVGYKFSYARGNKFIIATTRPGALIGVHGKNVELLKSMLLKEYHKEYGIEFIELDDFYTLDGGNKNE